MHIYSICWHQHCPMLIYVYFIYFNNSYVCMCVCMFVCYYLPFKTKETESEMLRILFKMLRMPVAGVGHKPKLLTV